MLKDIALGLLFLGIPIGLVAYLWAFDAMTCGGDRRDYDD